MQLQFTTAQITSALRWAGTAFAGFLVQHAVVTQDATPGVIALVIGVGTFVWSQIQKMQTKAAMTTLAAAPATPGASPAVPK